MILRYFWICLGGTFGTGIRYTVSLWAPSLFGTAFPYGTLIVNLVGSFLIGVIMQIGLTTEWLSPNVRLALTTGIMGGLTTYSTFNYETLDYLRNGAWLLGGLYVCVTLIACLAAGVAGLTAARWLAGA